MPATGGGIIGEELRRGGGAFALDQSPQVPVLRCVCCVCECGESGRIRAREERQFLPKVRLVELLSAHSGGQIGEVWRLTSVDVDEAGGADLR